MSILWKHTPMRMAQAILLGFTMMFLPLHAVSVATPTNAEQALKYQTWGEEVLDKIETDYYLKKRKLYASASADTPAERRNENRSVAMMWACGVQLSALGEATLLNSRKYQRSLVSYINALDTYWRPDELGGYDVLPMPKPKDRYYDDNAWIVLGLIKAYEATGRRQYLTKAEETLRFVLSGEDEKLGGGIYWKEVQLAAKHACSTGPAIVAALKIHRAKKSLSASTNNTYLETALRLHKWMREKMQGPDGLYYDNYNINGKIDEARVSYNTGLMIRAECLLFQETGKAEYLLEAQRIARVARGRWLGGSNGGTGDVGRFCHLLLGGLLELNKIDNDPLWLKVASDLCLFVHANARDPNGLYPASWGERMEGKELKHVDLLDQASAAHLYLETARAFKEAKLPLKPSPEKTPQSEPRNAATGWRSLS